MSNYISLKVTVWTIHLEEMLEPFGQKLEDTYSSATAKTPGQALFEYTNLCSCSKKVVAATFQQEKILTIDPIHDQIIKVEDAETGEILMEVQ